MAGAVQFEPASSTWRFRVCLTDLGEIALLPAILQRIGDGAPLVEVEVIPMDITQVEGRTVDEMAWGDSRRLDGPLRPIKMRDRSDRVSGAESVEGRWTL